MKAFQLISCSLLLFLKLQVVYANKVDGLVVFSSPLAILGISLFLLLIAAAIYVNIRNKKKRKAIDDQRRHTVKVVGLFAANMHEHQTVDSILWDAVQNCIGRLRFENCVIYLVDQDTGKLIPKASFGITDNDETELRQQAEAPVNTGVAEAVVVSGETVTVNDTSSNSLYTASNETRIARIATPIVYDQKVLGVIECGHHKKGHFNQTHRSILIAVASLCANKIARAKSEEEKKNAQLELLQAKQKQAEIEMRALRAQMNPHFIFNSLNSINKYILKSDHTNASRYLTRFAKLIRLILDNSNSKEVALSDELEALKLYIEMEALRFANKFEYEILVDENVHASMLQVPPLIIQPYVENAIWHGLLHKEEGGRLIVEIKKTPEDMLQCTIEDNGIGRARAKELKSKSATTNKSLGMKLTAERISMLNQYTALNASIQIEDLANAQGDAAGTKVVLTIPI